MTSVNNNGDLASKVRWTLRVVILNSVILATVTSLGIVERRGIQRRLAEREHSAFSISEQNIKTQQAWKEWRDLIDKKMDSIESKVEQLEKKRH